MLAKTHTPAPDEHTLCRSPVNDPIGRSGLQGKLEELAAMVTAS